MVLAYAIGVERKIRTVEEVPAKLRDDVIKTLTERGYFDKDTD